MQIGRCSRKIGLSVGGLGLSDRQRDRVCFNCDGRQLSRRCTLFMAREDLLECLHDGHGRIAGQLATMQTTIPYKRMDWVLVSSSFLADRIQKSCFRSHPPRLKGPASLSNSPSKLGPPLSWGYGSGVQRPVCRVPNFDKHSANRAWDLQLAPDPKQQVLRSLP